MGHEANASCLETFQLSERNFKLLDVRALSALQSASEMDGFEDLEKKSTFSQSDCNADGALSTISWYSCF